MELKLVATRQPCATSVMGARSVLTVCETSNNKLSKLLLSQIHDCRDYDFRQNVLLYQNCKICDDKYNIPYGRVSNKVGSRLYRVNGGWAGVCSLHYLISM